MLYRFVRKERPLSAGISQDAFMEVVDVELCLKGIRELEFAEN